LKPGPLEKREFQTIFGVRGLPKFRRKPLVLFTGSGIGNVLVKSRQVRVNTIHGQVKLLVGEMEGVSGLPVVVVPRHANPAATEVGHQRLPHQVNEPAYSVVAAALDPVAVVTMHTIGVAKTKKSFEPGRLTVIRDFLPTRSSKTIFSEKAVDAITAAGYSLPHVAHTPLSIEKLANPRLTTIISESAKQAKLPLADDVICHTIPGPTYETSAEVRDLVARGVTGFSMTHQNDAVTIQEALAASGSKAMVASIATISNFAQGIGETPSHAEVERLVHETAPKRAEFLKRLAKKISELA